MTEGRIESLGPHSPIIKAIRGLRENSPYWGVALKDDEMGRREKEKQDYILGLLIEESIKICNREDFEILAEIVNEEFDGHIPFYIAKRWMGRLFELANGPLRSGFVRRDDTPSLMDIGKTVRADVRGTVVDRRVEGKGRI